MSIRTHGIHLVGTTTVGPKGQVVIPVEAREKMGVKPGDKVIALYVDDKKTVAFMSETEAQAMVNRLGAHVAHIHDLVQQASDTTTS